jgi:hypothetical protein
MADETRNAEVVRGALQAVFSEQRLDQIDQYFSPSFVQHSSYAPPGGRNELRQWWAGIVEAIPDVTTTVEQLTGYCPTPTAWRCSVWFREPFIRISTRSESKGRENA